MKRAILPALMMALLLSGCGGGDAEAKIEARRDALAAAEELSFTAAVTADLGDEVFECTLACTAVPETMTVEVLAPETIAGVRARMTGKDAALEYDGVLLSLGAGAAEALSPAAAMPLLANALRAGHVVRAWAEEGLLGAEIYASDEYELTIWFSAETLSPVRAAVWQDGTERLRCEISEFTFR